MKVFLSDRTQSAFYMTDRKSTHNESLVLGGGSYDTLRTGNANQLADFLGGEDRVSVTAGATLDARLKAAVIFSAQVRQELGRDVFINVVNPRTEAEHTIRSTALPPGAFTDGGECCVAMFGSSTVHVLVTSFKLDIKQYSVFPAAKHTKIVNAILSAVSGLDNGRLIMCGAPTCIKSLPFGDPSRLPPGHDAYAPGWTTLDVRELAELAADPEVGLGQRGQNTTAVLSALANLE